MIDTLMVEKFLNLRDQRLTELEIASKLVVAITEKMLNRPLWGYDNTDDRNICQFFLYIDQILFRFIVNTFVSVIGAYDKGKDDFKAWRSFNLHDKLIVLRNKEIPILSVLKHIRHRYAPIRNQHISHIDDSADPKDAIGVHLQQIEKDIDDLREILNFLRKSYGIPYRNHSFKQDNYYHIFGINKIFEMICVKHNTNPDDKC